jgi:hypothetical protein
MRSTAKPSTAHAPVAMVANSSSDITRRKVEGAGNAGGGGNDVNASLSS